MHKVSIIPTGEVIEVKDKANLRDSLIANGNNVYSKCGGCASCADCIVVITDGHDNLNEIPFEEKQLLGNVFHITNERLACQAEVLGDITVDITDHLEAKTPAKPKIVRRTKEQVEKHLEENPRPEYKPREGGWKRPNAKNLNKKIKNNPDYVKEQYKKPE